MIYFNSLRTIRNVFFFLSLSTISNMQNISFSYRHFLVANQDRIGTLHNVDCFVKIRLINASREQMKWSEQKKLKTNWTKSSDRNCGVEITRKKNKWERCNDVRSVAITFVRSILQALDYNIWWKWGPNSVGARPQRNARIPRRSTKSALSRTHAVDQINQRDTSTDSPCARSFRCYSIH